MPGRQVTWRRLDLCRARGKRGAWRLAGRGHGTGHGDRGEVPATLRQSEEERRPAAFLECRVESTGERSGARAVAVPRTQCPYLARFLLRAASGRNGWDVEGEVVSSVWRWMWIHSDLEPRTSRLGWRSGYRQVGMRDGRCPRGPPEPSHLSSGAARCWEWLAKHTWPGRSQLGAVPHHAGCPRGSLSILSLLPG